MHRVRLAVVATAASGLVAAGLFAALGGTANAGEVDACSGTGTPIGCTLTGVSIDTPQTIELRALTDFSTVDFGWSITCTSGQSQATKTGGTTVTSVSNSAFASVPLPIANPDTCVISATAWLPGTTSVVVTPSPTTASPTPKPPVPPVLTLEIDYNPQPSSTTTTPAPVTTATASPVTYYNLVHGYDGKCVDDTGYSSASRAKIQIWSCNNTDPSQGWTYRGSELKIHGNMCIDAQGSGKSGSKAILWPCDGSPNEIWIHSNGEFVLKANNYKLCLDDPAYSTKNGTQLMVYACNKGANQRFSLP
jgi:hypothetical protein